jgi:hypothetical protein
MQNKPFAPIESASLPIRVKNNVQVTSPSLQSPDLTSEVSSFNTSTTTAPLCSQCKTIDWQNLVSRLQQDRENLSTLARSGDEDVIALDIPIALPPWSSSSHQDSATLNCPVCSFFTGLKREAGYDESFSSEVLPADKVLINLGSFTANRKYAPVIAFKKNDEAHYGSLTGILHAQSSQDMNAPRVMDPRSVDWSVVQGWLHECTNNHNWKCRPTSEEPPLGFRVIDIRSGEIVKPPAGCQYLALSYVWGGKSLDETEGYPLTIRDAMKVTSIMGFDYICEFESQ